jgi:hypothetical protein
VLALEGDSGLLDMALNMSMILEYTFIGTSCRYLQRWQIARTASLIIAFKEAISVDDSGSRFGPRELRGDGNGLPAVLPVKLELSLVRPDVVLFAVLRFHWVPVLY